MLKLGLLQCDFIDTHMHQHSGGDYPDMFSRLLQSTHRPFELSIFDVVNGSLPQHCQDFDGFIITGSRHSTYEAQPWIEQLTQFIQHCHAYDTKVIGSCFGHQIIAHALGGTVNKAAQGWGIGIHPVNIKQTLDWMHPHQHQLHLIFSHQDQVIALPKGATIIAESHYCAVQMYTIGQQFLGIQAHPEMSLSHIRALLAQNRERYDADALSQAETSLSRLSHDGALIGQWMMDFFHQ